MGLFLLVKPSGSKSWVQRVMFRRERKELGLGGYPVVTLAEARDKALENKRLIRAGIDPSKKKEDAPSFEEAAKRVHQLHLPSWRNEKHGKQFISTLETYAFPHLGSVGVDSVTSSDVLKALQPLWLTKPETARRLKQRIGVVLKWAIAEGYRIDNPADSVGQALPKQGDRPQNRRALHYNQVRDCLEAVEESKAWLGTKLALRFIALTAARSGEVRGALWGEVDLDAGIWEVPALRMKAYRLHRVPLSVEAIDTLERAKTIAGPSGLIFPSQSDKIISDATLPKLIKSLGYDADVHGFRTSFRTWTQERTNFPREVAEAALAHSIRNKAEAAYARSDLFERRREMMQSWASYLSSFGSSVALIA